MQRPHSGLTSSLTGLLAATALLCSPSLQAASEADPWEAFNRPVFTFNDTLDRWTLKPLAQGYQAITPDVVETGVSNVFNNLGEPVNLANNLLQGKLHDAGVDTARLLANSTLGLLGIFDVASMMGLERNDEDFGQTLGAWGLGSGPYLVLPLLGPSSPRDAFGLAVDSTLSPYSHIHDVPARNSLRGLDLLDTRAELLAAERTITGDRYIFIRNAYLQNREFRVMDGAVIDDF